MTQTDQQNVPKLRFPGFEGEWNTAQISDWLAKVIDYRGKAPPKTETGVPLITARNVKMGHLDFEADEYIDSALFETWMNRGRPNPGDVMFTTEAPLGNVAQYPAKGTYALGQRIITLQAGIDRCDSGFLFQTLLGPKMQRKVDARGTGSTAKGIKSRLFVKIPMTAPTLPEQRKIAEFLGAVDTKIAQLAEKKRLLEDYKKGCMQQLFSQKIRFKDEDGNDFPDWEEKRLGEVFTWANTNSFSRERLTYDGGQVQNIHYGDIHTKFSANFHQDAEPVPYVKGATPSDFKLDQFCRVGDVVIADASEDYADIGKAIEIVSLGDVPLVAGLHTYIARPCQTLVQTGFPGYLLRSDPMRRQIERIAQGISVLGISKRNLEKLTFFLPHPDEQRKIADFLSALDRKIDLVGQELTHARSFKQGLLQQMFV